MLNQAITSAFGSVVCDGLGIGLIGLDSDCRIIFWNDWMEKHSGLAASEIDGQNIFDRFPSILDKKQDGSILGCMERGIPYLLSPFFHDALIPLEIVKEDSVIPMKQNIRIYPVSGAESALRLVIVIEDFTEQILHEAEILRLNRVLRGIRNVNQLITRVKSEDELLGGACKILVDDIGYAFSWVGFIEEGSFDIKPRAFAGIEREAIDGLVVKWDESEYGNGVTGKAIKTGKVQVVQEIQEDPMSRPWHEFATGTGYQSTCSLPLMVDDRVIGALNVHSPSKGVFLGEELDLLEEVTDDIAYAISAIRERNRRRQAEDALSAERERLAVTLRSIGDGVIATDVEGTVTLINNVAEELTGWSHEEAAGKPLGEIFHIINEKTRKPCENPVEKVMATGTIVGLANHTVLISRDGTERALADSGAPIRNREDEVIGAVLVFRDITEKLKLESQLQRAQKMEAMGIMAGGVAHDLNNILSGIVSYPQLLLMDLPEDSPLRDPIKTIYESGLRAADVVEDLMTIARGAATGKEALNLNTLVAEYLGSAEYQKLEKSRSFVDLKSELEPGLLNMSGSPTHIKKTLMNLVANATEAIEGSGTVTISTANRYLDEPLKGYEAVRTGEYVVLTVSDDGSGISPQDLERIFEPFYTKRVMGRIGTGLGLAVVWNAVQDHKGCINVKSSENGTAFELYFPVTRETVAAEVEEVPVEDYLGHGEKILVVDDEENQREIASGMLTRLGYTAEAVSSGEEAIEYVKENPVDLIVLDMVMPKGINGRKTYEEIIKIRPGQKAIIASGYAKTREVDMAQELGAGQYIKKPYISEKIGVAIKEELEK